MGMIETTLIGVIQDAPKFFTSQQGYKIASLRVQVEQTKMIRGESKTLTSWHTVKVFGAKAELLVNVDSGDTVLARGELRRNKFVGKDGQEKVTWEIAADHVEVLFKSGGQPSTQEAGGGPFQTPKQEDGQEYTPF